MKIKTIVSQHRRDFTAIYLCQHCGFEETRSGYDDEHFHSRVIPAMPCDSCGKTGGEVTSAATVPAHVTL